MTKPFSLLLRPMLKLQFVLLPCSRCEVPRPSWAKVKDTEEVKQALEAPEKKM